MNVTVTVQQPIAQTTVGVVEAFVVVEQLGVQGPAGTGGGTGGAVDSVNNRTGDVIVTKSDVGLSSVDNTSDNNKPVSIPQATAIATKLNASAVSAFGSTLIDDTTASDARDTLGLGTAAVQPASTFAPVSHGHVIDDVTGLQGALDGKQSALAFTPENIANKGAANGYVPLDTTTKIASTYLPSYVDDILPFATFADFPAVGERGKIYDDLSVTTDSQYRWNGTSYSQIISSPGSTDSLSEGGVNLYHTASRVRSVVLTGLAAGTNAVIVAGDTILGALANLQAQITARLTQAAADLLYATIVMFDDLQAQIDARLTQAAADLLYAPIGGGGGADPLDENAAIYHVDEFLNNSGGTGAIGMLGWKFTGGTIYVPALRTGYPGLVGLRSAASPTVSSFYLGNAVGTNIFRFDEFDECRFIAIPTASNTDCTYQYGPMSAYGSLTPANGVYVERLSTDTNYFYVCRAAGVQTRVDSGVAFAASAINLRIRRVGAADVRFSINGGAETTIIDNVPAGNIGMNIGLQRGSTTATTRDVDLDRIALKLVPIAR